MHQKLKKINRNVLYSLIKCLIFFSKYVLYNFFFSLRQYNYMFASLNIETKCLPTKALCDPCVFKFPDS